MTSAKNKVKAVDYTKAFKPKHYNKWVALNERKNKVIAYGSSPKEVLEKVKDAKEKNITITIALKSYYGFVT